MSKTVYRELDVELSSEELRAIADDLANRQIAYMALKAAHRVYLMEARNSLKNAEGAIEDAAIAVRDKRKKEMVPCIEEYDHGSQKITLRRQDTGDRVEIRAASEEEIQEHEDVLQGDLLGGMGDDGSGEESEASG